MAYKKTIVCLANSRKYQGRCVAGLEWNGSKTGRWIRPVSGLEKGVLVWERFCSNANGRDPRLLDVIEIEFLAPQPHSFQTENHRIDPRIRWTYRNRARWQDLLPAVQNPGRELWTNCGSSRNGLNDVIPEEETTKLTSSLMLVQPDDLLVTVTFERSEHSAEPKRRMRGEFILSGTCYIFSITDCRLEEELKDLGGGGEKMFCKPLVCLSVSELFAPKSGGPRSCYKLIAGVVPTNK